MVGGLGPESTVDYYRRVIARWQKIDPSTTPPMVIDSLDPSKGLRLAVNDRAGLVEYLLGSIRRLEAAGVDFIAITANTPHLAFDELANRASVPLISIVEVCAEEAKRRGFRRPLLLGTRFTMEADFYPSVFARHGLEVVVADETDRTWVHARYVDQLLKGSFLDGTRDEFVALVARQRAAQGTDAVILGGTELPLLLRAEDVAGLPILDTTELHVRAIVKRLRA